MRCIVRGLIAALLTALLCLYVALNSSSVTRYDYYDPEDDEAVRLLEGIDVTTAPPKQETSISAVIVVVICLIIISVLIAGIIVIALSMEASLHDDMPSEDEESSFLYPDNIPEKPTFAGLEGYDDMFDDGTSTTREL